MLTSVTPWVVCFVFFTLLHWSYPADLAMLYVYYYYYYT